MTATKRKPLKLHLLIFMFIVLASGWVGVILDSFLTDRPEGNSLGMGLWLILPFLSCILLRVISRDWNDFGIKLNLNGNFKWYFVALLIYPCVTVITISLALIFGVANITNFEMSSLFSLILMSTIGNFIKNIFEEFSWRGYLTPKLIELKLNDWFIYIISGLVWALWHAAYYLVFYQMNISNPFQVYICFYQAVYLWFLGLLCMLKYIDLQSQYGHALLCMQLKMPFLLF